MKIPSLSRRVALLAVATLAAGLWIGCNDHSTEPVTGPSLQLQARSFDAQVRAAIAIQDRHTDALLKIPVTILGAAGAWWLTVSYMESTLAGTGPMGVASGMVSTHIGMEQVVIGVFGLVYPIALLIALQTRAVKDYYDTVVT